MTLRLSIENADRLPDGGPLRIEVKGRGLDLGRDAHLDWTLPDPSRTISGKHCEIRYRDGGYWLHDISKNGTFVNEAHYRLDAPHRLRDGDRLSIGPYIIAVSIDGQRAPGPETRSKSEAPVAPACEGRADVWSPVGDAPPPEDRDGYRAQRREKPPPDFLDFAAYLEQARPSPQPVVSSPGLDDWVAVRATPHEPAALPPETPSPRRPPPVWSSGRALAPQTAEYTESSGESASGLEIAELLRRIALAAGIPEKAIVSREPEALADEIGAAIRLTAENLAQMLSTRAESKSLMRSSSRTMVHAHENNPLKFGDSIEEALAIMFGPPTRRYLDAKASIERSFADLKAHQLLTFGAMQGALDMLFEDLAPDRIDHSVEPDRGLGRLVSRKAKLWDVYTERWRTKTKRADGRLLDAFMKLFAEAYDRLANTRR